MIPYGIKGLIAYIASINIILTSIILWLQQLNHVLSDILSVLVAAAGLIVTYYTILKLREDLRGKKLDNAIKQIELEKLKDKDNVQE